MKTSSIENLTESPTSPLQMPGFMIRYYNRSDDVERIRNMFVQATLNGPDAPVNVVTSRFAPKILRACIISASSLASFCALSRQPSYFPRLTKFIDNPLILAWIAGGVSIASAFAAMYFWRCQSKFHKFFGVYIEDALAGDLNDIPTVFGLSSREGSSECFPVGSRGFWVAEEEGTIIGFVGLGVGANGEEKVGEVRRIVVSPSHRRRGVGKSLMHAVDQHAKANGIHVLELTTSDFHIGPLKMYHNIGWRVNRRRNYAGVLLPVLRKNL